MENRLKPEHEEANSIIEEVRNNDLTRLEKFKRWAKDSLVGVSALAISIAGIITTIVIGARKALKKGAQATGKFAKVLYNLGKKLGPLLAPLLNIIAQAITWGAGTPFSILPVSSLLVPFWSRPLLFQLRTLKSFSLLFICGLESVNL